MESKLNALAIETYNTAFSNRIINDFYARHEKINGEQILQLSPVPQVNLFVIKNLFNTWQKEAASMRSPYFNYQHPKVQEAQKAYMNTLSRHIAVDEAKLKPLLLQAVQDTLILIFTPILHIQKALQASSGSPQDISETLRYVKINQAYAQEAKNILNQQDVTDEQWLEKLIEELQRQETAGHLQPEPPHRYMEQFSQVLPLKPSEVLKDEELEAQDDEHIDFFSSLSGRLEKEEREQENMREREELLEREKMEAREQRKAQEREETEARERRRAQEREEMQERERRKTQEREEIEARERRIAQEREETEEHERRKAQQREETEEHERRKAQEREEMEVREHRKAQEHEDAYERRQETAPIQQTQAAPEPEEDLPTVTETAARHAQLRRTEPDLSNRAPEISISRPESNEERSVKTLNEKFGREYKSLNEKLTGPATEKQPVIPLQHIKKAGNIRSGISLNQRFMFTNELFDGNSNAFNQALDQLDGFENYQQAYQYCLRHYARTYDWDLDSDASLEFMEILQSRYRV